MCVEVEGLAGVGVGVVHFVMGLYFHSVILCVKGINTVSCACILIRSMYTRTTTPRQESVILLCHSIILRTKPNQKKPRMSLYSHFCVCCTQVRERQHRVMGLYQELRQFNTYGHAPTTVRIDLSGQTSDLDLSIEWGNQLAGEDSSLRIQYRSGKSQPYNSTSKTTDENTLKLPKIDTSRDSRRRRLRRKHSQKFIFLDDDVLPQLELRHSGAGFYPDVTWFIQPGVPSEQCDVGFSAGRSRGRKDMAWQSLKNKCMPRVHIMRALELKSFARVPRLRLDCSGDRRTAVRH